MSYEAAASRKAEMLASEEIRNKIMNGDVEANAMWRRVTECLSQPVQSTGPVDELVEFAQQVSGNGLSPEVIEEVRDGRAVTPHEHRAAHQRLEARQQDPEWRAKYFRNDPDVRKEVALINIILASPVRDPQVQP